MQDPARKFDLESTMAGCQPPAMDRRCERSPTGVDRGWPAVLLFDCGRRVSPEGGGEVSQGWTPAVSVFAFRGSDLQNRRLIL